MSGEQKKKLRVVEPDTIVLVGEDNEELKLKLSKSTLKDVREGLEKK